MSPGSKRKGKTNSKRVCCGQKWIGAGHLTFKQENTHRRGHLFIDQRGARGRDKMKNRDDITEGRKGKRRQRHALIASWQTKQQRSTGKDMKARAGLRWHTKKWKNYGSSLPRVNVSAWDEMSMCARRLYMCVVIVGCPRGGGGCCRYKRRTFNLHSNWVWRGSVLIIDQHPGGINYLTYLLLPSSPETQAVRNDFGSATWTRGVVQNNTAAAPRCLERGGKGRELLGRTAHTTWPRQTKHSAAG